MSTEVTPDLLRRVAAAWEGGTASDDYARHELRARADRLERQQLPTVPGWYPGIVVERGGESCTGALRSDDVFWYTARAVGGRRCHLSCDETVTIRWAEQDGPTPDDLDQLVTVESLREQVDAEHAAWLSAENALHEANGTVESLRAERDEALAEMEEVGAAWRQEQIMHRKAWATIRNLQAELADTRIDVHKANAEIYRLRASHTEAEAARGRCSRED